ncbi:ribonuclease, Rne/Rng family [Methylocella silvestris BL2]|uniref:Ribonuclease E n=1 Tax=Methylocella silvestris (strain DSM 15510 / CIP 108128 / LMG 27833 / NCIMB 13906 / BL2) TaxID=395965 RepID=B8EPB2_METSB|nr:ribonuclease E/G [Methylocella silvestris]ACK49700.1 ribonuclease, Rne/Rng family [Methylocella silvestris BL2]
MANKMLIDASHPEETRVVVLRGNRVEEFDFESASKKQLRGNIYLAKVTRVEPSLQAAFVDYGGNRHGFLAFSEIHPDYYQIPVVDRQALIEEEARAQQREADDEESSPRRSRRHRRGDRNGGDRSGNGDRNGKRAEKRSGDAETLSEPYEASSEETQQFDAAQDDAGSPNRNEARGEEHAGERFEAEAQDRRAEEAPGDDFMSFEAVSDDVERDFEDAPPAAAFTAAPDAVRSTEEAFSPAGEDAQQDADQAASVAADSHESGAYEEQPAPLFETGAAAPYAEAASVSLDEPDEAPSGQGSVVEARRSSESDEESEEEDEHVEQLGGDAMEEVPVRPQRYRRQYKIQEVIKRRQVLLVQVVKEERGNKGAALTTYLSLAGRYSVLMPNTARGGGISRKITDSTDRQRLKSIAQELEVPEGMGVILRTAGASRTKPEVKRDFEYLLRMWETVRETTLKSSAPTLVYEEGSLIKRAIRDLFNKDIDDIVVAGDKGYREARDFMRLLMPSHVNSVQPYRDAQPIFSKSDVETQLDAMFLNQVTLKSGGYIVINQTEALVAIDVNSGRSTREHNIEDTALRTNLEAADEVARQLRLRDLAGLIVVDFIDMEEGRNNRAVERRLKDALKNDRARIQVGRISHFGLLEMSRQRIRTGVLEGSTELCPHCSGSGILRSTASIALHVLRVAEDALLKSASHDLIIRTRSAVALYILNEKRAHLRDLERRFGVAVSIEVDDSLIGSVYHAMERGEPASGGHEPIELAAPEPAQIAARDFVEDAAPGFAPEDEAPEGAAEDGDEDQEPGDANARGEGESEGDAENRRKRRRRRRRGRGGDREGSGIAANAPQPSDDALGVIAQYGGLPGAIPSVDVIAEAFENADYQPSEVNAETAPELAADESGEVVETSFEREAAPAKPARRPRRARSREAAPEEAESAEPVTDLASTGAAPSGVEGEEDDAEAAQPARRSRRTPRPRAPRRAASELPAPASEAEAATLDLQEAAAAPAPLSEPTLPFESAPPAATAVEPPAPSAFEPATAASETEASTASSIVGSDEPAPGTESNPPESDRPKRSGWWQRAKATLGR